MESVAHDIFLLASNLSQLKSREQIVKVFIESMNSVFPGFDFAWFDENEKVPKPNMQVCTRKRNLGYVHFRKSLPENPVSTALIQNMAQLLAVILEKIEEEELLSNQEIHLRHLVDEKTRHLNESEEILSQFMENSPIYIFFKDSEIRSLRLSRNFENMLGRPLNDLLGKTMDDLFPSDLAKKMIADDQKILNDGKSAEFEEELDGKYYFTVKFPISIENKPKYLSGYTIDITKQKKTEKALKVKLAELESFNNLMLGRELKMVELKKEVNELLKKAGEKEKYRILE